jgi:tyrosine-protein kinase Etk/Wzc
MTTPLPTGPANESAADDGSVDLFEILTWYVLEWRRGFVWALGIFVLGTIYIYTMTPLFEANVSLLPQATRDSSSALASLTNRTPGDVYLGLLSSRSVQDDVIQRAGLLQRYRAKSTERARETLASRSVFTVGKDTLIVVQVRDPDAQASAQIADAYLDALEAKQRTMSLHQAEIQGEFLRELLRKETEALNVAEQTLQKVQESTGIVQPEAQTQIGLNAIAGVRGQITALRVRLAGLLLSDSEQNAEVRELRSQIGQLEAQEQAMESKQVPSGVGAAASAVKMPGLNLEYTRRLREVKYHEALITSISNQYEAGRISVGQGTPFQIVDRAVVPEHKAWPARRPLLGLLAFVSILVGFVVITATLFWRRVMRDPIQIERLALMSRSFRTIR